MKKRFSPIVLAECLLIAALLLAAILVPRQESMIPASAFDAGQSDQVRMDSDSLTIDFAGDGTAAPVLLTSYNVRLRPGAYDVCVTYESDVDGSGSYYAYSAVFQLDSGHDIAMDQIRLNDAQSSAAGRVWVPLSLRGSANTVGCISYLGSGTLTLHGVQITENIGYRFVCILALALALMLIHALYALFFSSRPCVAAHAGVLAVLAGIVLAACLPSLVDYAYEGHDIGFHLKRIATLAQEIRHGQFPVRMHTTVGNGYSYPLSLYYGDFLLYIPAILYLCAVPLQTCFHIYTIVITALTCFVAYACFRKMTGQQALSLLGTALYVLSSYRLNNIYVRAAVGEYTALTFMPLVLLGMYRILQHEKPRIKEWLPLALGMTGVVLSHVLSTEMLAFDLLLLCACLASQALRREKLGAIVKAALLCLLLSAWFVVPFADCFLRQRVAIQATERFIQDRGLYPVQLLSLFTNGYGFEITKEMPLTIGASLVVGLAAMLYCLYRRHRWQMIGDRRLSWLRALTAVAALNMLMTLIFFPWDDIQWRLGKLGGIIGSMQFPWRWLSVSTVLLVMGVVFALQLMQAHDRRMYMAFCGALIAALVMGTGYFYFRFHQEMETYTSYYKSVYESSDDLYLLDGTDREKMAFSSCDVEEGEAVIESYVKQDGAVCLSVRNDAQQPARISIPVFAYHGYRALDSMGNALEIGTGDNNRIELDIPVQYSAQIEVRFVPPVYWRAAEAVSLAALLFVIAVTAKNRRNAKRI